MKPEISDNERLWKTHKSYTPEEVLAAGGTTAFAQKRTKETEAAIEALKNAPPIEPFSDDEWAKLMDEVARDK
jgi:hypothetical protein